MILQIVGVQRQDFKLDSGYEFHGIKVHCVDRGTQLAGLQGCQILDFKVPDGHPMSTIPIHLNKDYRVFFDQKGRLDFMSLEDGVGSAPSDVFDEPPTKTK